MTYEELRKERKKLKKKIHSLKIRLYFAHGREDALHYSIRTLVWFFRYDIIIWLVILIVALEIIK